MKTCKSLFLLLTLSALAFSFAPRTARADTGVSFDFFYDTLDPYGEWVEVPDYGFCWHPSNVGEDWAPYSDGYWAYTDAGWTWVSYEDWGAVTYHYGRWMRLNGLGWCWVPGYEWGPAWVSWRSNDDCIGWAPLPPEALFEVSIGIGIWADATWGIGPGWYHFCHYRDFGAPAMRPCIINPAQNAFLIGKTQNITNITFNGKRHLVFNGGPDYRLVQERSLRPVQTLRLVQQTDVNAARAAGNGFFAKQHGNQLEVFAPAIIRPTGEKPRPKNVARVMEATGVDKGWGSVPTAQVQQLKTKISQQTGGVPTGKMRAKPVTDQELRIVSENSARASASQPEDKGGKVQPVLDPASSSLPGETPAQPKNDKYPRPQVVEEPRPQNKNTLDTQQDSVKQDKELQRRQQLERQQQVQERLQQKQLETGNEQPQRELPRTPPSPVPQAQQKQSPSQNEKHKGSPTPAPGQ